MVTTALKLRHLLLERKAMTLMLGNTEGGRRKGQQRMSWLDGITDHMASWMAKSWTGLSD